MVPRNVPLQMDVEAAPQRRRSGQSTQSTHDVSGTSSKVEGVLLESERAKLHAVTALQLNSRDRTEA